MSSQQDRLSIEEFPLRTPNFAKRPAALKGPLRVLRLCILGILLPTLLIAIPLYMRYHVYSHQFYPLAMSDMRLIDNKVSTTWCQRQLVRVNTTFNAFLMQQSPILSPDLHPLSMVRHLTLEDDMKEYWGFYLLKGSSVTVSTCVRWPGASLIVIRGHKHLHECAYIGDNSSEELDELMEAIREGTYIDPNAKKKPSTAPVNQPDLMKRHRLDVEFHQPDNRVKNSSIIYRDIDTSDISDPQAMKTLLDSLQYKKQLNHVHRNSTIAENETNNIKIKGPNNDEKKSKSKEALDEIYARLKELGESKSKDLLRQLNLKFNQTNQSGEHAIDMKGRHYSKPAVQFDDNIDNNRKRRQIEIENAADSSSSSLSDDEDEHNLAIEEGFKPDGIADHRGIVNETTLNDRSNSEFWSSFSSSEEALLNCAGLILNLPLTPHHKCDIKLTETEAEETYIANTITYKVPENGYYFFVFNSENEVQPNYIRVKFHLKKTLYNVSNAVASCMNSSAACSMDLRFFSNEKLVMELPVRENASLWNEEFVVVSECEPRTAIYIFCVVAVPVLVVLFAFS